jgi:hypothetical protein
MGVIGRDQQRRIQRPQIDEDANRRQHRDQGLRQLLAIVRFQLFHAVDGAGHQLSRSAAGLAQLQEHTARHCTLAVKASN